MLPFGSGKGSSTEHRIKGNEKTQHTGSGVTGGFHKNAETERQVR